jgi:hypothetical protein
MTALEKLNALQAGELDKVLPHGNHNGIAAYTVSLENNNGELSETIHQIHWAKQNKLNAAKVEVTKVIVHEYLDAYDDYYKDNFTLEKANRFADALVNLIQLKETL